MQRTRRANRLALGTTLGIVMTLHFGGCSSDDSQDNSNSAAGGTSPLEVPSELNFKKIEQEFQGQQQQVGQHCPGKHKVIIEQTGQLTIEDSRGRLVIQAQLPKQQLAEIAITANEVVAQGIQQQTDCDDTQAFAPNQGGVQQTFITAKDDRIDLVSANKDGKTCDFTKGGKGKQLQQQINSVVQQGCNGNLPTPQTPNPTPTPTPTTSPNPSPSPSTSPTPGPSPTPTPSPSPSTGGEDTQEDPRDAACNSAYSKLLASFTAARACSSDDQCNYINELSPLPRDTNVMTLTEFSCGFGEPKLTVANGLFVETNRSQLMSELNAATSNCDLFAFISRCDARGEVSTATLPVCRAGACVKGR